MKKTMIFLIALLFSCGKQNNAIPNFIKGFSGGSGNYFPHQITGQTLEEKAQKFATMIKALGGEWYRMSIPWGEVEEWIDCTETLRIEEITDEKVEGYMNNKMRTNWDEFDKVIKTFHKEGIQLIVGIGVGYSGTLPCRFKRRPCTPLLKGEIVRINPDILGRTNYLSHIYLFTRAAVRRYKKYVKIWQIENELNVACETVMWGWRTGEKWCDPDFRTELISILYQAVKEEDPSTLTTHNFHTDIHWIDDARMWLNYLDVIGIDAYPNYLNGTPIGGTSVGERVRTAVSLFYSKPVVVIETGYPTHPPERNFSESNQSLYICDAYKSTVENGGRGFLYFTLITSEEGGEGLQMVEPYWGLFRKDGTKKLAWEVLKNLFNGKGCTFN